MRTVPDRLASASGVRSLDGCTVLAVFAHPDDESLAAGGTLIRLADRGARVVLVCATRGEQGGSAGEAAEQMGHMRARELMSAAAVLGLADVVLLNHPDGALQWSRAGELHAHLVCAIDHYAPDAIITFGEDGLYWHPDHIAVHERTTAAVLASGGRAPALYYATMPPGVMRGIVDAGTARGWTPPSHGVWSLAPDAFGAGAQPATIVIDVGNTVDRKLAALASHCSQMASGPLDLLTAAEARRSFGTEHFHRSPHGGAGCVLESLDLAG